MFPWLASVSFFVSLITRAYNRIFRRALIPGSLTHMSTSSVPLALTAEQGFGYFPARPGLTLNERYEVSRMLGSGQKSSVFLVRDLKANGCVLHSRC